MFSSVFIGFTIGSKSNFLMQALTLIYLKIFYSSIMWKNIWKMTTIIPISVWMPPCKMKLSQLPSKDETFPHALILACSWDNWPIQSDGSDIRWLLGVGLKRSCTLVSIILECYPDTTMRKNKGQTSGDWESIWNRSEFPDQPANSQNRLPDIWVSPS